MLGRDGRERAEIGRFLTALCFLGLVGTILAASSWVDAVHRQRTQIDARTEAHCTEGHDCGDKSLKQEARQADAAEASFDLGVWQLAFSVVGIAFVGWALLFSARATEAAVEATEIARKALEGIERPFLVLEFLEQDRVDGATDLELELAPVPYCFINHGKTPAIIGYLWVRPILHEAFGAQPVAPCPGQGGGWTVPSGVVVGVDKPSQKFTTRPKRYFNGEPILIPPSDPSRSWFIMGYVRYRDLMGHEYIGGFCAHRHKPGAKFVIATPFRGKGEYNYDRRSRPGEEEPPWPAIAELRSLMRHRNRRRTPPLERAYASRPVPLAT